MKYVDDFRDKSLARRLAAEIAAEVRPDREYRLMEFCGGHTHAIFRYGVTDLLPPQVRMIHGPGCPVCVLPVGRLDMAIRLAKEEGVTLCTYGDMLRVPGSKKQSLLKARAEGPISAWSPPPWTRLNLRAQTPKKRSFSSPSGSRRRRPPPPSR
jgi:hydrogenase expression/formation protein HypD